jgi:cob(I)alamin adenosyltransferase
MGIYTKTGDKGETGLYGGKRVSKADSQIDAYGTVDELTSFVGLVIAKLDFDEHKVLLTTIQRDLYEIMGILANAPTKPTFINRTAEFEKVIDTIDKKLPKLTRFILPQGGEISSWFHVLRTICRRSERAVIGCDSITSPDVVQYLNRLSDLFFILARQYGQKHELVT